MTATAETQAPDAAYEQLAERNAELVEEKFALIERLDAAESREQELLSKFRRLRELAEREMAAGYDTGLIAAVFAHCPGENKEAA